MKKRMLANCVSCAIGILINFSSVFGLPCVSIKCIHSRSVNKTEIVFSKLRSYSAIAVAVFLITVSIHYTFLIITASTERGNLLTRIGLLSNLIFCVRSSAAIIICICKSGYMVSHFKGFESIRHNWKITEKEDLLELKTVRRFRKEVVHCFIIIAFLLLMYLTYLMISEFDANWNLLHKIATILCLCVDSMLFMIHEVMAKFSTAFFSTYQKNLRNKLLDYKPISKSEMLTKSGINAQNNSLRRIIVLNKRLHCALVWNVEYYNKFYDLAVLLWLITAIALLVSNCFVLLTLWIDRNLDIPESGFIGMESQIFLTILTVTYSLYCVHKLGSVSQDTLSFLFQYPISKLNAEEAAQVETLITVLSTKKPILNGMDIFIYDVSLLASITGTVLTYVLVAFQFSASWVKQ
ncbi:hypothetical protein ILUMI_09328 [Ignelater luminosus]|uniref:Gustatory receptor n=1 Tax=Ignelater luminosus TaxID=2038154 RepID=A0A8K0GG39_IGNLU|nr:hypothetical protein ILUMI_09328 [Ignelater luminosus]